VSLRQSFAYLRTELNRGIDDRIGLAEALPPRLAPDHGGDVQRLTGATADDTGRPSRGEEHQKDGSADVHAAALMRAIASRSAIVTTIAPAATTSQRAISGDGGPICASCTPIAIARPAGRATSSFAQSGRRFL
jgi:hypothetical protein